MAQDQTDAQGHEHFGEGIVLKFIFELFELATLSKHQKPQAM